jgi:hypothetical protein
MTNEGVQLPAPDDPRAPKYWMHETGGELVPAIGRLMKGAPLAPRDIAVIRAYVRQWINSPVWDMNAHAGAADAAALAMLRQAVDGLTTAARINLWLAMADAEGMNPL